MCIERQSRRSWRKGQCGVSLIEMLIFIVIVGVALAGVLSVLNLTSARSADPLINKQMLSLAEALLEEVQSQPFTYCDPADARAATASSPADCANPANALAIAAPRPAGQVRGDNANPYNNVVNYVGLALPSPIADVNGDTALSPAGYSAAVALSAEALDSIASGNAAADMNVLRITVTIRHALTGRTLTLEGFRTRYSPNSCAECVS